MKKNFILIFLSICILSFIIYKLYGNYQKLNQTEMHKKEEIPQIPVTVTTAKEESQIIGTTKTGLVIPFEEAKVFSTGTGTIKKLLFKLGDKVYKGQPLAIIDTQLLELELKKSESNVAKLRTDLETYTELQQGNASTQRDVDAIRQVYNDAVNQSSQLRKQISDAVIKSPINGVINSKNLESEMFTGTGGELGSIINCSKLKVKIFCTESEVYKISLGQKIKLSTDVYPEKTLLGKVSYISPQATDAFNFVVEIAIESNDNLELRSGTLVYADFSQESSKKMILVPRTAINESILNASVYVVENGKAILKKITVGEEFGDNIEVTAGLNVDEQVVISGQINLQNGTPVKIIKHNP
ncbi:efflux RND transporter periplasmic adaptor subunit [Chryseobacterium daeguense]|uniref:efflux RND transporter periplasmic adaptor subunit n=1 Tax=Chryseobacterium daeguense TaxID=412438 RepID=UPI0004890B01|nr:efflux RND transporter periplasmic adaptor subunit [Chryseobacterium daeguense]